MTEKFSLHAAVSYADVDRNEALRLPGVFKFLQEAAIAHANRSGTGTRAMVTRGESWMLNRMAIAIDRYPRYEESLRIETWSSGIKSFKGFRDFRVYGGHDALLISGSSLWLYVAMNLPSIVRVPPEIAAEFPECNEPRFCPDLDSAAFPEPSVAAAKDIAITLRYSDIDANRHVNNTAYLDFVQTALARAGMPPQPHRARIKFIKSIPADTESVNVRLEPRDHGARFSVGRNATVFALGDVA